MTLERERPITQTINASVARQEFSQIVNRVFRQEARVLIEKSGIPVAAIVSTDDLALLRRLDDERRQRFAVLDRMREAFRDVPPEEIEQEVASALSEVRAERRAEMVGTITSR